MAREVFLDTSGLYALVDRQDPNHGLATRCVARLANSGTLLALTDYILDEACTLAKVRGGSRAALRLLDLIDQSEGFQQFWIAAERFNAAKAYFRKHHDHGYSFTDCTSFVLMRELDLCEVLTTDRHFREAGFRPLLPVS